MLNQIINIAKNAGEIIMGHYSSSNFKKKIDGSPVTLADLESSSFICNALEKEFDFPVLSEENLVDFKVRKHWDKYWLVDPLDGTKDFLEKNDEFTVNISLINDRKPYIGVIYAPASNECWWGLRGAGAYKDGIKIVNQSPRKNLIGLDSRHHQTKATNQFFNINNISNINLIGSSLKMCRIAEGAADIYPRLNGTKEWDTAASEVILIESGCSILTYPERKKLLYNKRELSNPFFIAYRNGIVWK